MMVAMPIIHLLEIVSLYQVSEWLNTHGSILMSINGYNSNLYFFVGSIQAAMSSEGAAWNFQCVHDNNDVLGEVYNVQQTGKSRIEVARVQYRLIRSCGECKVLALMVSWRIDHPHPVCQVTAG